MAVALAGLLFVPVALGILVAGVIRLVDTLQSRGAARGAQARSLAASAATGVAGFAATFVWLGWASSLDLDLRLATLPALGCTVAVLTAAVAELTWPRPTGAVRTANLGGRRATPPAWLPRLVGVGLAATVAALAIGTVTAAAAVRSVSMVRVLRPAAAGSLSTAAGLWLTMGATVNSVTQNLRMNAAGSPQPPFDWVQDLGFTATAIGLALLLLALGALGVGSPRLPRQEAAPAPDTIKADA